MTHITLVSTSLPEGLRGALNQWMLEVQPGTFVGRMTSRVREEIWTALAEWFADPETPGFACLVETAPNEQGYTLRTLGSNAYSIEDFDGLLLVSRHHRQAPAGAITDLPDPTW